MADRDRLVQMARETCRALEEGSYALPDGRRVSIRESVDRCVAGSEPLSPEALRALPLPAPSARTPIEVRNESTLEGAARLWKEGARRIGALNFASAKNPGGGFLSGAQAQEESLARTTGLYSSLQRFGDFYGFHRAQGTSTYSDRMIYSPGCPVFRADDGAWLESPFLVDLITAAAPNLGALRTNEPERVREVPELLRTRSRLVLALAAARGCEVLVLGAWGCGAFRNDPAVVSSIFAEHFGHGSPFAGAFRKVVFSVLDRTKTLDNYRAFEKLRG